MLTTRKSAVAIACLMCSAALTHGQTPTIVSAIVNSPPGKITIVGSNLAPAFGPPVETLLESALQKHLILAAHPSSERVL
jgi:hypothetical protein